MTTRSDAFNKGLRNIVEPVLNDHGFKFDKSRTFRRVCHNEDFSEIINFQLGQRSTEGTFTVNLAVFVDGDADNISVTKALEYHCKPSRRERLRSLMPNWTSVLAGKPILRRWFPATTDKWWKFSENEKFTQKQQAKVLQEIMTYGIPWLESNVP